MARQNINNLESGSSVRTKMNNMFIEVYDNVATNLSSINSINNQITNLSNYVDVGLLDLQDQFDDFETQVADDISNLQTQIGAVKTIYSDNATITSNRTVKLPGNTVSSYLSFVNSDDSDILSIYGNNSVIVNGELSVRYAGVGTTYKMRVYDQNDAVVMSVDWIGSTIIRDLQAKSFRIGDTTRWSMLEYGNRLLIENTTDSSKQYIDLHNSQVSIYQPLRLSATYGLPTAGYRFQVTGDSIFDGNVAVNTTVTAGRQFEISTSQGIGLLVTGATTEAVYAISGAGTGLRGYGEIVGVRGDSNAGVGGSFSGITRGIEVYGQAFGATIQSTTGGTALWLYSTGDAIQVLSGNYRIGYAGYHDMILGGSLSTDGFRIRNSSNSITAFEILGNNTVNVGASEYLTKIGGNGSQTKIEIYGSYLDFIKLGQALSDSGYPSGHYMHAYAGGGSNEAASFEDLLTGGVNGLSNYGKVIRLSDYSQDGTTNIITGLLIEKKTSDLNTTVQYNGLGIVDGSMFLGYNRNYYSGIRFDAKARLATATSEIRLRNSDNTSDLFTVDGLGTLNAVQLFAAGGSGLKLYADSSTSGYTAFVNNTNLYGTGLQVNGYNGLAVTTNSGVGGAALNLTATNGYIINANAGDYKISYAGYHNMILGGALDTDGWRIRNSTNTGNFFEISGTGKTRFTGTIGINSAPDPSVAMFINSGGLAYGMYVQGTNIGGTFQSSGGNALVASGTVGIDATGTNIGGTIYGANYGAFLQSPLIGARVRELTGNIEVLLATQDYSIDIVKGNIRTQDITTYADNAAAVSAGLSVGVIYKTSTGELRIVV